MSLHMFGYSCGLQMFFSVFFIT